MTKRKKIFVIPAELDLGNGETGKFEDYPDAVCFGDQPIADILNVAKITIINWRKKGVIPSTRRHRYHEYHVLSVVNALKEAGYAQDSVSNPIKQNI